MGVTEQLMKLGFISELGSFTRYDADSTSWQCNCFSDRYAITATSFTGGIISVSMHFPLHIPVSDAVDLIAAQLTKARNGYTALRLRNWPEN